jgi:small subunit ribosomal protein S4
MVRNRGFVPDHRPCGVAAAGRTLIGTEKTVSQKNRLQKNARKNDEAMKRGPKHKLCRRIGSCVWGSAKCPSAKRPYPAGASAKSRRGKLSTYGELLLEKQKLRAHYAMSEKQLRIAYAKSRKGTGSTPEKFLSGLEMRLASVVYRSGLAPTIFAAKQAVTHGHVMVNGTRVDRNGYLVKQGDAITIDAHKSPAIFTMAQKTDAVIPPYLEVDRSNGKVTLARTPMVEEIPVPVEVMRVVEYYAR